VRLVPWFGSTEQSELEREDKAPELEQPVGGQEAVHMQNEEAVHTRNSSDLRERAAYYYHTRHVHFHLLEAVVVVALETEIGRESVACCR